MLTAEQKKIVILDADHSRRDYLKTVIHNDTGIAFCFDKVAACFDNLIPLSPDLIVVGSFPRNDFLRFIHAHKATNCNFPSLLLTQDTAVKKYLALNGLSSIKTYKPPLNAQELNKSLKTALKKEGSRHQANELPFIVGNSPGITKTKEILPSLADSAENILIQGEKGTGKEVIARTIHYHTSADGMFIKVDAPAINRNSNGLDLLDIIHEAYQEKKYNKEISRLKNSETTLFIEELGCLPAPLQAELLLLPEEDGNPSKGLDEDKQNSIRIIASSSEDLRCQCLEKRVRPDLFYRLNIFELSVLPLRFRKEDIPLLTDYFSYKYCKKFGRSFFELSKETIDLFLNYGWPGNIRELEDIVKRAVIMGDEEKFQDKLYLKKERSIPQYADMWVEGSNAIDSIVETKKYIRHIGNLPLKEINRRFMTHVEKKVMEKALEATNWNRKKAASILNISYKSILNKIRAYGLA